MMFDDPDLIIHDPNPLYDFEKWEARIVEAKQGEGRWAGQYAHDVGYLLEKIRIAQHNAVATRSQNWEPPAR